MTQLRQANKAVLVIEVADSSVKLDQEMAFDYAAAGVPEYWLVNVRDRNVEVFRVPMPHPGSATGYFYSWHQVFQEVSVAVATFVRMS